MDIAGLTPWIARISALSALIVGLVTALWAYTKFIVERGLLPPTQFDIECTPLGNQGGMTLLEIILHMKNCGSSALIATNIRADLRYLRHDDELELIHLDGTERTEKEQKTKRRLFGRVNFPGSVRRDLEQVDTTPPTALEPAASPQARPTKRAKSKRRKRETRGFSVMPHDTFVQPGIDQQFAFQTAVPVKTAYVLVWSSFEYAQSPKPLQRAMLWLSRQLGLVQFTLRHVSEPHSAERVFRV
jgi:hypothetical protein